MKQTKLSVNHGALTINNCDHLHISQIDVFTGDDNYIETDSIEVTTTKEKLCVKQLLTTHPVKSEMRIRNEPGCRIHIDSEEGTRFLLTVSHHKGSIQISTKEIQVSHVV
jgi:hypothetical protein